MCYGSKSAEVETAVQDGVISVLLTFASRNPSSHFQAVQALMSLCLRGTKAHRRVVLAADVVPMLTGAMRHVTLSGDPRQPKQHSYKLLIFVANLLHAQLLLLRTAKRMDAEAGVALATPSVVASRPTKVGGCISRADIEQWCQCWHPMMRTKAAALLREHFS
jgi:hypothetical protein